MKCRVIRHHRQFFGCNVGLEILLDVIEAGFNYFGYLHGVPPPYDGISIPHGGCNNISWSAMITMCFIKKAPICRLMPYYTNQLSHFAHRQNGCSSGTSIVTKCSTLNCSADRRLYLICKIFLFFIVRDK
jgi:hypothetical protein